MSTKFRVIAALAIGALLIVFKLATGQPGPRIDTYTGAAIYWASFAYGLPVLATAITWLVRRKFDDTRRSEAATTFLVAVVILSVSMVAADLLDEAQA